jgi:hypothetical protein
MIGDMVGDLSDLAICDIEKAIETYRKTAFPMGKFKPFPDSGTLRQLAAAELKHRSEVGSKRALRTEWDPPRPNMWWTQSKQRWNADWQESEVPAGELIRDVIAGPLRQPNRAVF